MHLNVKMLFPPQKEVLKRRLLTSSQSCILHMSTGSGKTFLSEFAIDYTIAKGLKAIYVTPLRALAEQQSKRWQSRFKGIEIGVFTGETIGTSSTRSLYSRSRILIMTPERLDAVLRNWRSHWNWLPDLGLVIVDEVHLLGMPQRGPRLEGALTRLIRLNPFVRIIGLSATIPNSSEIASWLGGSSFSSSWRHIPLEKKILRFSSAKQKHDLLLAEVSRCTKAGGQSLVFCNSRSRVEQIATFLKEHSIPAAPHHAGLVREARGKTEELYKSGTLRVLVATSTLEMGLNLPARQVVIYDSYSFNGTGFENIPVWSFIQRAGRAGRPGLDTFGEVVLMLSRAGGDARKYINEDCEPVESHLTDPKSLAEQVLIDVFTGLCRTHGELSHGFLPLTLYKRQHPAASLSSTINRLMATGLLEERQEEEKLRGGKTREVSRLRVNALGRLAVRLMLAPETIEIVRDAIANFSGLKYMDVLLLATLSPDCSPVLQANFEEMDELCTRIQPKPSTLLDQTLSQLRRKIPGLPTTVRILGGVKMAAICMALTEGEDAETLAETFNIYTADIRMVQESVVRILQGIAAIATTLEKKNKAKEEDDELLSSVCNVGTVQDLAHQLQMMITYRIPEEMVPLTRLSGVGGKRARKLVDAGYESLGDVSAADPEMLVQQKVCGRKLALSLVEEAYSLVQAFDDTIEYREGIVRKASCNPTPADPTKDHDIDLYRFRRALELSVKTGDAPIYHVTGGREAHKVLFRAGVFTCDCEDFKKRRSHCKHIYAVRLSRCDKELIAIRSKVKANQTQSVREVLPTLWFDMTKQMADT